MLGLPIYLLGSSYYLHTRIAGKQVKKSLRTSYKRVAIIRAVAFLNSLTMSQKPTIGDFAHLLTDNQTKSYEIDLSRGILKAEDSEDHQRLMQALQAMQNGSQPVKTATSEAIPPADDPTALKLGELLEKFFLLRKQLTCHVPDDWLLTTKRPLLHSRQVLQAVVATWQSSSKEPLC